jgi:hypothetical protein
MPNPIVVFSYIAGLGLAIASIFKFKQHKDNSTQISLAVAVVLLVAGLVLILFGIQQQGNSQQSAE